MPFQLENKDRLPSSACLPCIKLLDEVRKLREKISASQLQFQQLLANQQPLILPSTSKGDEMEEYITEEITVEEEQDEDDDSGDGEHGLDDDSEDEVGMDAESFIIEEPEDTPPPPAQQPPPAPTVTATKSLFSVPATTTDPVKAGLEEEMARMDLLICHLCKKRLPTYPALNHHFQSVHEQTGYIFCCNQKFGPHTAHYHIKFHQKAHPDDLPKPLPLPVTRELKARATPARPKRNPADPIECPQCGKVTSTMYNLQLHMKTHVPMEEREKSHICDVCGKAFDNPRNLSQHLDIHKNNVSQQCPICHKYFFRVKRHIQKQHERVRTKEVCTICGQVTTRLAAHMKDIHTESDERYTCDICWKEFRKPRHLKKHYTTHLGIRLTCHFCPHQATNSGNLSVHCRAHHAAEYEEHKAKRNSQPKYKEF